ncbi:Amino acid transporter [Desulfosarcina cetonica]|uniref:APC family permease n=1 Tax=Desulfosarcina cetonica TaxID=90730 RepID=UPI0006CF6B54|nr:APC family permease [Desulfosarcina cetonica]VTR71573.1 Amino acid transporter [Desulfosarcina cetonica]
MQQDEKKLGFWPVVAIGIGGMVGGGIFAVLGLSVQITRGAAPMAFFVAGLVALATAYAYTRLSVTFPGQGGTVTFLDQAFGSGLFTGTANVLLWISYIVMLSLYAYAFGSYGAALFPPEARWVWKHVLISAAILGVTGLNFLNVEAIGRAETWIVAAKIAILLFFIGVGAWTIDGSRMDVGQWPPTGAILAGAMIIFLAYEGFELIANTAGDVRAPKRTLPRAYYSAVGFVILLYVMVAAVTIGNLPVAQIVNAQDYALAEAARPFLGSFGYLLITVAALLSTLSAINATLYGAARLSYTIAKDGELPEVLERKLWNRPVEGLLITSGATLLVANLFDLSSISTMGSAGFLLIFAAVNAANAHLASKTGSRCWISVVGSLLCLGALSSLILYTWQHRPSHVWVLAAMLALAFAVEGGYRLWRRGDLMLRERSVESASPGAGE